MDKNFTSGASSVTVQYSVTGNCQNKVSFEKDSDFISTSQTSTSITISVSENRGEARTGHVYTRYDNTRCDNNTITIRQDAGPCIPAGVSYQYDNYSGSVEACDTSKTVTVSGAKTTTYTDESCRGETERVTTSVTLNFDKNTSSDERTIQSSFTINDSEFAVTLTQSGGCEESDKYLTIKSLSDDNKIYFKSTGLTVEKTVSASTDNGSTWTRYSSSSDGTLIATLNKNEKICLTGGNSVVYENVSFTSSGEYEVYGNIMSLASYGLLYGNAFKGLFSQSTKLKKAENLILPSINLSIGCFQHMFSGCTSLETAPKLPATKLAEDCYQGMFAGCTSLTTAPELPATTLAIQCYSKMFSGCTNLTTAPELPATTLKNSCYDEMFRGCTGLTTTPELPAETLGRYCYSSMFAGCTSLTTAPELPATILADGCYQGMFAGCASLRTTHELPATALTSYCYQAMFDGCTSLTEAPSILPAATLTSHCYEGMFNKCASLTTAPQLPATTLAESCYYDMFFNCTSLEIVPSILPATTLASQCYRSMFYGCARITKAPELPATTLTSNCYYSMFQNCANLNYIKAMFTTTPSSTYTGNWVSGVSNTGTFVKNSAATWENTFGSSAIPKSTTYKWTVETATA